MSNAERTSGRRARSRRWYPQDGRCSVARPSSQEKSHPATDTEAACAASSSKVPSTSHIIACGCLVRGTPGRTQPVAVAVASRSRQTNRFALSLFSRGSQSSEVFGHGPGQFQICLSGRRPEPGEVDVGALSEMGVERDQMNRPAPRLEMLVHLVQFQRCRAWTRSAEHDVGFAHQARMSMLHKPIQRCDALRAASMAGELTSTMVWAR